MLESIYQGGKLSEQNNFLFGNIKKIDLKYYITYIMYPVVLEQNTFACCVHTLWSEVSNRGGTLNRIVYGPVWRNFETETEN